MADTFYKIAPSQQLSAGQRLNSQTYNYGLVTGPAFSAFEGIYSNIINCSRASGLGFHHLTLFAMSFQARTEGALALAKVFDSSSPISTVILNDYLPSIAYLLPVELGPLQRLALSSVHCETPIGDEYGFAKHEFANGLWEYLYELVRQTQAPQAPSRSEVIFASPDKDNAAQFMSRFPSYGDTIWSIDASKCDSRFVADMAWLNNIPSTDNADQAAVQVQAYWKQMISKQPIMEVLLQGEITVTQSADRAE